MACLLSRYGELHLFCWSFVSVFELALEEVRDSAFLFNFDDLFVSLVISYNLVDLFQSAFVGFERNLFFLKHMLDFHS